MLRTLPVGHGSGGHLTDEWPHFNPPLIALSLFFNSILWWYTQRELFRLTTWWPVKSLKQQQKYQTNYKSWPGQLFVFIFPFDASFFFVSLNRRKVWVEAANLFFFNSTKQSSHCELTFSHYLLISISRLSLRCKSDRLTGLSSTWLGRREDTPSYQRLEILYRLLLFVNTLRYKKKTKRICVCVCV